MQTFDARMESQFNLLEGRMTRFQWVTVRKISIPGKKMNEHIKWRRRDSAVLADLLDSDAEAEWHAPDGSTEYGHYCL